MLESAVETRLIREVKKLKCECWKFTSPGRRGVPDRIVICPERQLEFVETKKPGETPEPLQRIVHKILGLLGFTVWVIDSYEEVDGFVEYLKNRTL